MPPVESAHGGFGCRARARKRLRVTARKRTFITCPSRIYCAKPSTVSECRPAGRTPAPALLNHMLPALSPVVLLRLMCLLLLAVFLSCRLLLLFMPVLETLRVSRCDGCRATPREAVHLNPTAVAVADTAQVMVVTSSQTSLLLNL